MYSKIKASQLIKISKVTVNMPIIRFNSSLDTFCEHVKAELDSIRAAGTYKNERIIVTKQGSHIKVAGNNNQILNFCANNYLGLSVCCPMLNT